VPAIGQEAAQGPLAACGIKLSRWGTIEVNEVTYETSRPGVFAAGDVTYGPRSIIQAAAHGRQAALSIHAYLRKVPPQRIPELPEDEFQTTSTLPPGGRFTLDLRPLPREEMPLRSADAARDRSVELARGLSEEQARREASRCLRCDLSYLCPAITVAHREGVAATTVT